MRRLAAWLVLAALLLPASAAEPEPKYVALTFDDGPSGKYTQRLLDGLQDREVKATFLLCGYRIRTYPEIAQRIFSEGHEIGYHGFSHKTMEGMSRRSVARELMDCQALLPENCDPVFFRPPGGIVTDGVQQVAQARQLAILSWSVDPRDWAGSDAAAIRRQVLQSVHDGDIILLHDMTYSSVQAALDIVDSLQARGYTFLTVSELAQERDMQICPGRIYKSFPPRAEK